MDTNKLGSAVVTHRAKASEEVCVKLCAENGLDIHDDVLHSVGIQPRQEFYAIFTDKEICKAILRANAQEDVCTQPRIIKLLFGSNQPPK